ncbi:MAG: HDOD domain-containing protein [Gammaproteobacteria bacterium]
MSRVPEAIPVKEIAVVADIDEQEEMEKIMQSARTIKNIRSEIQKINNLPPLPMVAQQLLGAINDKEATIEGIARIIKQDPALTSRILGLANSAFFGFGRKVFDLEQAIINVLGLDLVKGLALTMVMGKVFDENKCRDFDITRYWGSALMTADLAMRTAVIIKTTKQMNKTHLFLYGLLHNLGVLILTDRYPELMGEIFSIAKKHPDRRLIFTEQAMLDMDHHQAGAWLARKWQLPEEAITVIEHHQYPDYQGHYRYETLMIGFCSRTTRNWILGKDILLPDEDNVLSQLGVDKQKMEIIAEKSRSKLEEFRDMAREMAR